MFTFLSSVSDVLRPRNVTTPSHRTISNFSCVEHEFNFATVCEKLYCFKPDRLAMHKLEVSLRGWFDLTYHFHWHCRRDKWAHFTHTLKFSDFNSALNQFKSELIHIKLTPKTSKVYIWVFRLALKPFWLFTLIVKVVVRVREHWLPPATDLAGLFRTFLYAL